MARRKKSLLENWQDNWAGMLIGAVIVIILVLLVVNFFNRKNQDIGNGEQIDISEQEKEASKSGEYKVVSGDSLSKLAERYYGSMDYWPVLARANKIANPNIIYTDMTLTVPSKQEAEKIKSQMTATSYDVKEGDTLFKIAQEMYGNGSMWTTIAKANNLGRLPNGNLLVFAGSKIKIPR